MTTLESSDPTASAAWTEEPRDPWSFLAEACRARPTRWDVQLALGWLGFSLLGGTFWALHLRLLVGSSALPNYWGELLTARDLWELVVNGGLARHWSGPWTPLVAGLSMIWFLWAGWRLQAQCAGVPARLGSWAWGFLDALVVGALPLALPIFLLLWLGALGEATGIPSLGWLAWVGGGMLRMGFLSALFLQWWLCRLDRAGVPTGPVLGSWQRLGRHLARSFRRLWVHPGQWAALVLGGVALRAGLTFLVLALAWRLGGSSLARIALFLACEATVVLVNAWLISCFLRLAALFYRHDAAVAAARR
jgi:hypothetical protein